jgi:HAD superfamily hydrolase (TIGR01509 family)
MKNIKVVAFDCDGVMFDTKKANTAYYNSILAHLGKPGMTPEQFEFAHMHTVQESLAYLFDEKELDAANAYRKRMTYAPFIKAMEIEPYLKPLLGKLRPDYKTAIATNRTDTMSRVLSEFGLEGSFDLVVTALDVAHPKPHPEELLKIISYFEIESSQLIYVGDSALDQLAASAAGVPFVAYDNQSLEAAFHITGLKEMEKIVG